MAGTLGYSKTRALTGDPVGSPRPGESDIGRASHRPRRLSPIGHPSLRGAVRATIPYMPGLDGLRAIAVMAVVLYHGDVESLKGGFLGVEVFFVISGYLITSILLAERRNTFRIDLARFYSRRAKRLLPALFAVLFASMLITVVFFRDEVGTLRGDVASSLLYVTNWFFVFGQKSYFEAVGRPSLVQHLWSLAVEEQFYLLWPLLFAFGMRVLGRRRLFIATLAGAVASTVLMALLYRPGADPTRVYYGTDTRAAGLLIGAALAFVWAPYRLKRTVGRGAPLLLNGVGFMSLGVLIFMLSVSDQYSNALYYGGFARLALVTAVVIAVAVHPAAFVGKILGIRPIRWVGLRSYGIYLYHWPIFQLTRPQLDIPLAGLPLLSLRLGLTFGAAALSYRYIEMPIRTGAAMRRWSALRAEHADAAARAERTRWMGGAAALTFTVLVLVVVAVRAEPPTTPQYLLAGSTTDGLPPAGALPPPPASTPDAALPPLSTPEGTTGAPGTTDSTPTGTIEPAAGGGDAGASPNTTTDPSATTVPLDPASANAPAAPTTVPAAPRRINAIGDSVMLGAAPTLMNTLNGEAFVDARVGRQVSEALGILQVWKANGLLGDVIVVHIGNNGSFSDEQFAELRSILAGAPKVIFMNDKVPRTWEEPNNQVIATGAATMPNAVLIDWRGLTENRPELFWNDGMHLRPEGAAYYASLINAQL